MIKDVYYYLKHIFQKDKGKCPRCRYNAFEHGYDPRERYYCTRCGLWEPNWKERDKWLEELKEKGII